MISNGLISPAGLYLLSAGTDNLLVLWDISKRKPICQRATPATVSAVAWHPLANQAACISEEGSIAVWADLVPAELPGPHVSLESLQAHQQASLKEGDGERGGSMEPTGEQCQPHCIVHWLAHTGLQCILA